MSIQKEFTAKYFVIVCTLAMKTVENLISTKPILTKISSGIFITLILLLGEFSTVVYAQINPTDGWYNKEPAPMGITDYGIDPSSTNAYFYSTTSYLGIINIISLPTNDNAVSFQLNVNLNITTNSGNRQAYFLQESAFVYPSGTSQMVAYDDEIYNFTTPTADVNPDCPKGPGNTSTMGPPPHFYGANSYGFDTMSNPTKILLRVNSTMTNSGPVITSQYEDTASNGWVTFDTVTLTCLKMASESKFAVTGMIPASYSPKMFNDAELIMAGPGGLANIQDSQSNVNLQLKFWNGNNYQMVPTAYKFGDDTGETMSNAIALFDHNSSNGEIFSSITSGSDNPCTACTIGPLYGSKQIGTIGVTVTPTLYSGILNVWNSSSFPSMASHTPFVSNNAKIVIYPGTYCMSISDVNGKIYGSQAITIQGDTDQSMIINQGSTNSSCSYHVVKPPAVPSIPTINVCPSSKCNFNIFTCAQNGCYISHIITVCELIDCNWNDISQNVTSIPGPSPEQLSILPIVAYTDKPAYDHNSEIVLVGHVNQTNPTQNVTLTITDPSGNVVDVKNMSIGNNGRFVTTLNSSNSLMSTNGLYTIHVQQGMGQQSKSFQTAFVLASTVPEFGHYAMLMFAISIISLMTIFALSNRFKNFHN